MVVLCRAGRPLLFQCVALQYRGVVHIGNIKEGDLETGHSSRVLISFAADGEESIIADGVQIRRKSTNLELLWIRMKPCA